MVYGKNFIFRVFDGTDRSALPDKVTLSVDFGNVKAYDYLYSLLDYRNFVYIGGPGDGIIRTLETLPASSIPTGWDRKETFVDASECTEAEERTAKGNQVLAEQGATQTLDFTFDQNSTSFILGTDFGIGDIVVVDFPGVATLTTRIVRITERYDVAKGKVFEIGVGRSAPDLISIIRQNSRRINQMAAR